MHVTQDQHGALTALGKRIREQRVSLALSQEQMAERAGVHRTYYSAIERGERNLTILSLLRIAHAQNVDLSELLREL